MNQLALDLNAAMERADRGIESSGAHADRVEDGWRYQALALLTAFAREIGRSFVVEEARAYAEKHGLPDPPDARAYGSVVRLARAKGRIRKVGYAPAASSNGSPKCLWIACLHSVESK